MWKEILENNSGFDLVSNVEKLYMVKYLADAVIWDYEEYKLLSWEKQVEKWKDILNRIEKLLKIPWFGEKCPEKIQKILEIKIWITRDLGINAV